MKEIEIQVSDNYKNIIVRFSYHTLVETFAIKTPTGWITRIDKSLDSMLRQCRYLREYENTIKAILEAMENA